MCGILGAVNNDDIIKFESALNLLGHRGPDFQSYISENSVLLGHTRLSIIDLSENANQPYFCDGFYLIFNGEIYNYLEVRVQLEALGHKFLTSSDTEVLLASYRQWGRDCLDKLNGMWAFAIYDVEKQEIFLSRDRLGVKPLYYIRQENTFFFASEIKALLEFIDKAKLSRNELVRYLIYGAQEHRPETLINAIRRLEKSSYAIYQVEKNTLDIKKYFSFVIETNKTKGISQLQKELKLHVDRSIKLRLRSDVKIGMALSGGVDSNIIVSHAHKEQPNIGSYSAVYKDNGCFSEMELIKKTIKRLGLESHFITPNTSQLIEDLEKLVWIQDEPFDTLSVYAQFCVYKKMQDEKVRVSLDGQGADEIYAGYPNHRGQLLQDNIFNIKWLSEYMKQDRQKLVSDFRLMILAWFPKLFEFLYFKKRAKKIFKLQPSFLSSKSSKFKFFRSINCKLKSEVCEHLSVLLRYVDRNSMSNSIESRGPFLDYELVQFSLNIQGGYKFRKGYGKYILRRAHGEDVDSDILWKKEKLGFPTPQTNWLSDKRFQDIAKQYIKKSKILKQLNVKLDININEPEYWRVLNVAIWESVYNFRQVQ